MAPIKLAISGVGGRMGSRIATKALEDRKFFQVVGALESPGHPTLGEDLGRSLRRDTTQVVITDDVESALVNAQVLIEFTNPTATIEHARIAARHGVKMVIGTTGLTEIQFQELKRLARKIPILHSPNMSFGVYIFRRAIREVASSYKRLGSRSLKIDIVETHHKMKKDKPSGTAKQLRDDVQAILVEKEIKIHSRREGDVIGEHSVKFVAGDDELEFTHRATSRDIFVKGALFAAILVDMVRRPKLYTMDLLWDLVKTSNQRLKYAT